MNSLIPVAIICIAVAAMMSPVSRIRGPIRCVFSNTLLIAGENIMKMKSFFIPYYNEHKCDRTRPYEGVPEMLGALRSAGIGLGVASNKYQEGTEKLVARYFPDIDFVKVIGQRDGRPIKPDPEIVREIQAAADNANDDETVYIGDSDVDMQTGANAGVRTIGVSYGFRSREELAAYSPWAVCDTPEEVAGTILENTVMQKK